jgi:hypothetical protein
METNRKREWRRRNAGRPRLKRKAGITGRVSEVKLERTTVSVKDSGARVV